MDSTYLGMLFGAIGHLSFVLTFLSFAQKSMIRMRIIAVMSQMLGLAYNGWINYHMAPGTDINLVVFWLAMFAILNITLLVREISTSLEIPLSAESRELMIRTFPLIHSRDWDTLLKASKTTVYPNGHQLLAVGDKTHSLQLIANGQAQEIRDGEFKNCSKGSFWGELTYVMGSDFYNASPVDIVVTSHELTVIEWDYAELKKISSKSSRLDAALQNGFVHSAGLKHGLLAEPKNDQRRADHASRAQESSRVRAQTVYQPVQEMAAS